MLGSPPLWLLVFALHVDHSFENGHGTRVGRLHRKILDQLKAGMEFSTNSPIELGSIF